MEKAFLVGVVFDTDRHINIHDQLDELESLALTAGAISAGISIQKRHKPDPSTFIGSGKVKTIINQARELNCDLIIFNNDIPPTQIKNLQKTAGEDLKIVDRTGLILDIFTKHARTREAKTQVEVAQLEYLLPRLTRQWTHLERQMGGIGTRGGPGETQIEIDRRLIRKRITKLKKELKQIQKQHRLQSHGRDETYRIALVGYTNAGKSTIMNVLTGADVLVENQLFATLDTITRKISLDIGVQALLSDTVGFIRNLPHHLIASFRSTLNEIRHVDLLLKIFDASSENVHNHIDTVNEVLQSLNLSTHSSIFVFNKIDMIDDRNILKGLKNRFKDANFISAEKQIGVTTLLNNINNIVSLDFSKAVFHINYKQANVLEAIYALTKVINKKEDYDGIKIEVEGNKKAIDKISQIIENK